MRRDIGMVFMGDADFVDALQAQQRARLPVQERQIL